MSSRPSKLPRDASRRQAEGRIARSLHFTEATVKSHLLHIFAKLDVADRTAAVTTALEKAILHLDNGARAAD